MKKSKITTPITRTSRFATTTRTAPRRKRKMALVIAAHNEEMFLQATIQSAIAAGQTVSDIYVVDDGSTDRTRTIAIDLIGKDNVLSQWQKGKSAALKNILNKKKLLDRYEWIHFADSDTYFDKNYFRIFRRNLDRAYAALTGYIKSLPGTKTSEYRIYEYTWGMEVIRRFQSASGLILVIPGPSSCFRSDVLKQIDMQSGTLTEDFDWTLQLYRHNLGNIKFVPQAIVYTQDPKNIVDYKNQIWRWYRGIFQVARLRRLGLKPHKEDLYFNYQVLQYLSSLFVFFVIGPMSYLLSGDIRPLAYIFVFDFIQFCLTVGVSGRVARRSDIISNLPHFYMIRWISSWIFLKAFTSVVVLGRHMDNVQASWSTSERRYAISSQG